MPPGPARSWVAQGRARGLGGWCVAWAPGSPQLLRAAYCQENQRPGKVLVLSRSQLCHSLNPAAGPGGGPARLTSAPAWSRRSAEPSLGGRPAPSHSGPAPPTQAPPPGLAPPRPSGSAGPEKNRCARRVVHPAVRPLLLGPGLPSPSWGLDSASAPGLLCCSLSE